MANATNFGYDGEEASILACALDANGTPSPVDDVGWCQAWVEDLVSAEQVWAAAIDELGLED